MIGAAWTDDASRVARPARSILFILRLLYEGSRAFIALRLRRNQPRFVRLRTNHSRSMRKPKDEVIRLDSSGRPQFTRQNVRKRHTVVFPGIDYRNLSV